MRGNLMTRLRYWFAFSLFGYKKIIRLPVILNKLWGYLEKRRHRTLRKKFDPMQGFNNVTLFPKQQPDKGKGKNDYKK
jgi:hypothetical protein